jgi:acyl-coenzyme A synthetase/AMP-(fatty) acid ligase
VLSTLPDARSAAVVAKTNGHKGELWAYVEGAMAEREILGWLRTHLPLYMVPDRAVAVSALPLNPRGKVDRLALAAEAPQPAMPKDGR